jgi:hypothetical protein
MSEHPNATRLDALAAGDDDAEAREHLASCQACATYVSELKSAAAAFAEQTRPADDFVEELARRARPSSLGRRWRIALAVAPALAAAAALVLVLESGRFSGSPGTVREEASAESAVTRFKGALELAVIRERSGEQQRFHGRVAIKPGDRLLAEIGIAAPQELSAAFLGVDHSFVLLLAPRVLPAGTHHSERALRFDDRPTRGVVLAGSPGSIERARQTRDFSDVAVLNVDLSP